VNSMSTGLLVLLGLLAGIGLGVGTERWVARSDAWDPPSENDFLGALREADPLERTHRLSRLGLRLGPEALPNALEAFEDETLTPTARDYELLMLAWTRFDGPAAYAWATGRGKRQRDRALKAAVGAWALRDPRSTAQRIDPLEDSRSKTVQLRTLVTVWARGDDSTGLAEYLARHPGGRLRRDLVQWSIRSLRRLGPEAAMTWVEALPASDDLKHDAFATAAEQIARDEPRIAADWYARHRQSAFAADSLPNIARLWAVNHDGAELLAWLDALAPGADRDEAIHQGFLAWTENHRGEAEAWLGSASPQPRVHDIATSVFVSKIALDSPQLAAERAIRIRDPGIRRATLVPLGRHWMTVEPAALEAWLRDQDLPEDVRSAILTASPPRRSATDGGA